MSFRKTIHLQNENTIHKSINIVIGINHRLDFIHIKN